MTLKPGERIDDLHRKGRRIIQDPKRFCFGIDAVLLSAFAKAMPGERVADLGTGTGIIPILMEARYGGEQYYGLEIQEESAEMARRSVALNGLTDCIHIFTGDIKDPPSAFAAATFQVVTCNPPYMNEGGGLKNAYGPKAIARHEILVDLAGVVRQAARLLQFGGRFYLIHRPHRLVDLMCLLREYKLEPKRMRLVQASAEKEPVLVLIEAVRGGRPMVKMESVLMIYGPDGDYTPEAWQIYYGEANQP